MNIYTSYYTFIKDLPEKDYTFISVSNSIPKWFNKTIYVMPELYPDWNLVEAIKSGIISEEEFTQIYSEQLSKLKKDAVIQYFYRFSNFGKKDVILLCHEANDKFCHRHILADWLGNVKEFRKDNLKESEESIELE